MRRFWAACAVLALLALFPASATARPGYDTILWGNAAVSGANGLRLDITFDNGVTWMQVAGNNPVDPRFSQKGRVTLPTDGYTLKVRFTDLSCSRTYNGNGTPYDHVSTVVETLRKGTATTYYFRDAGWYLGNPSCGSAEATLEGTAELWNGMITIVTP